MLKLFARAPLTIVALSLAACSGGGGGNGGGLGQPGGGSNSDWQEGVFLDFNTFFARCAAPRNGTNPNGQPYPDVRGSIVDENNFLRSYTNDTYLWYDEVVDRDPSLYNDPITYFDLLRTTALTTSGTPKDQFHFTYDSEEWFQLSQSGTSFGYGITWAFLANTPPRDLRIAYTEPNSPATNLPVPLQRGAQIIAIDGVDVAFGNDVDTLNAGLAPSTVGEQHTFTVRDIGSATTRDVILTSASVTASTVQNTNVISTPTGEVGYLTFNDHRATSEQELIDAVNQLNAHDSGAGIDDLVLDLRYNGGGFLDIASELAFMIAGPGSTAGRIFEEIQFNDKHPATDPVTGQPLTPVPFHSTTQGPPFNATPGQALPTLDLQRVYVLTGGGTCSASESIINSLRGVGVEVVQIGSRTCGKPYGFYPTDNCGTTYFTIQFRGANDAGFGDYADGFQPANAGGPGEDVPGCSVADDFSKQLGDPTEGRLAAALNYRDTGSCPTATGVAPGSLGKISLPVEAAEPVLLKSPWQTNRILVPR